MLLSTLLRLSSAILLILCSIVQADNVLVVHQNYANTGPNIGNRLIAAGHTVTYATTDPSAATVANYQQVWDVRYSVAVSGTLATTYDTFIKNSGFLYLTTENPNCCAARNNSVAAFISNAGGGATTIGGTAGNTSNTLNVVNTTYMTAGNVVTFAAGASIINTTGTWLFKDSAGKVGGMMWIGNAGDLGPAYNGTVLTVSDINWTDSTFFSANNSVAVDDIIAGVVYGTVQGTISEGGNTGGGSVLPVYNNYGITGLQSTKKSTGLGANTGGHNAQVEVNGNDNDITIQQIGANGHYVSATVTGNSNTASIIQTSTTDRHYLEATVTGGNNSLTLQQNNTAKTQFITVNGNYNTLTTNQTGTGSHFLEVSLSGDHHTAGILQDGAGNHSARVTLDGTQPWNFTLNQNSATGQTYNLPHTMSDNSAVSGTCSTVGGCNLTVTQP